MDEEMVERAVTRAIKKNLGELFIDREIHYKHHEFIEEWMKWMGECKSTARKTCINLLVLMMVGMIVAGFITWGSTHWKG